MAKQFKQPVIEDFGADDIRAFYDSSVFRVWHLGGKERTFKITRVQRITEEFRNEVTRKAVVLLEDGKGRPVPLPFVLNATNRKTIQQLYGNRPADWVGKLITLYPSQTDMAGQTVDCIRVRPSVPGKTAPARGARGKSNGHALASGDAAAYMARDYESEVMHGPNGHRDVTEDTEEPPMGALDTDGEEVDSAIQ